MRIGDQIDSAQEECYSKQTVNPRVESTKKIACKKGGTFKTQKVTAHKRMTCNKIISKHTLSRYL